MTGNNTTKPNKEGESEQFINIDQALALMPGMSKGHLAQLRYTGSGPRFYKPTPRTVFYKESEVLAWLEESVQTTTATLTGLIK